MDDDISKAAKIELVGFRERGRGSGRETHTQRERERQGERDWVTLNRGNEYS